MSLVAATVFFFSFSAGVNFCTLLQYNYVLCFLYIIFFAPAYLVVRLPYWFLLAGFYFGTFFRCLITSILLTVGVEDYCCV